MQKLITKYGLAAHLALLAVAPLFLCPVAVLYLTALAAIWVLMEPSRIGSEMLHDARERVCVQMLRDPVFWVSLVLVAYSAIAALNTGVERDYNAEIAKWFIREPASPHLPGSVEGAGLPFFAAFASIAVLLQGCRHALGKSARFAMALMISFFLGCVFFVETLLPFKDVTLVHPVFRGALAGVGFIVSIVSISSVFERRWWRMMPFVMFGTCGCTLGLFLFAPPAISALYVIGAALVLFYNFIYLRVTLGKLSDFKQIVIIGISIALATVVAMAVAPKEIFESRVNAFDTFELVPDKFGACREILSDISRRIWAESPWLGTGIGSFALDLSFKATGSDWLVIGPFQSAPLNGYWQLLVETGVIGAFAVSVLLMLLTITFVHRFVLGIRHLPHPLCWAGFVLFVLAAVEMMVDCSYLSPAAIVLLLTIYALAANSFPKGDK